MLPLRLLNRGLCRLALILIIGYQKSIGILLRGQCRFYPTCSEYAKIVFSRFSFPYALWLTLRRLLRCQPLCRGGEDFPPDGTGAGADTTGNQTPPAFR